MTTQDKNKLAKELRRTPFGFGYQVENCSLHILLKFAAKKAPIKKIDLVPHEATFLPTGAKPQPTDRFKNNPKARHAVRLVKDELAKELKLKWPGNQIEMAVLEVQRHQKGQTIDDLRQKTVDLLNSKTHPNRATVVLQLSTGAHH